MEFNVNNIINKYGATVKIISKENSVFTKGIISPMYANNLSAVFQKRVELGIIDNTKKKILLPCDIVLKSTGGEIIETNGESFIVNSSGRYYLGDKVLYVWAVLSACTASVEDEYEQNN